MADTSVKSGGNCYVFDAIDAAATAVLDFEVPVKSIMSSTDIALTNDDEDVIYDIKANVVYSFPNNFGYPSKLYVKNASEAQITPKVMVVEYGDIIFDDYFTAPEIPTP